MRLGDATWTEIDDLVQRSETSEPSDGCGTSGEPAESDGSGVTAPLVLIPVGSTEQHGPHLPIATDTLIAEEIVGRAIHRTDGLMIGPTIGVTASGEHAGFPGTLSIGTTVMHDLTLELGRSADWAAGIVFVNGHGGNHAPITSAVATLESEGRRVMPWWPRWPRRADGGPADLHAGRIETSLMLAIDPGLVRLELAVPGADANIDELRERGVRAVSPAGVLGDPTGASGSEGERFISGFVADLVHEIERWRPITPTV